MNSKRPYREAIKTEQVIKEIKKVKGTLFDSTIVDICIDLFKKKGFKFSS